MRRLVLGDTDGGGFAGILSLIAGVKGGGISPVSKGFEGDEETKDGVGCFMKDRILLGLIS